MSSRSEIGTTAAVAKRAVTSGRGRTRKDTREAILDTALSLYTHSGYSGVTIRALADEMGLKAPSLYHYFASKEAMFVRLQERALHLQEEFMIGPLTDDPIADLELFFKRYMEYASACPEYFTLLYLDPAVPTGARTAAESYGRLREATEIRIRNCVEAGAFPADAAVGLIVGALLWQAALGAVVLRRVRPVVDDTSSDDFDGVRLIIDAIAAGLLPEAARARPQSALGDSAAAT